MPELQFLPESAPRNPVADWSIRIGVGCAFFVFGMEKFSSDPGSHWVMLFHRIGAGDWFRFFTGAVEILGGLLVLIPRTALIGLALLAATMLAAVLIVAVVLGAAAASIFPGVLFLVLVAIGWHRKNQAR